MVCRCAENSFSYVLKKSEDVLKKSWKCPEKQSHCVCGNPVSVDMVERIMKETYSLIGPALLQAFSLIFRQGDDLQTSWHLDIVVKEELFPFWLWCLYHLSVGIYVARWKCIMSMRISHVKRCAGCSDMWETITRRCTTRSNNANASRFTSSMHHLTWESLTENTLWGWAALIRISVWYNHHGKEGKRYCFPSMFKWGLQVITLPRNPRKCSESGIFRFKISEIQF